MRVTGYVRVSTRGQAEDGGGLDVQEATVRAWARAGGHRLVAVRADRGVSGALADRPGLADALEDLRARRAEVLVVPRLDRLARDLIVQETVLAEARRLGGEVATCAAGEAGYLADDPDDPSRRMIWQVLGAVSEYERSMIALRLRAGRRAKASRGGYAYGAPRYGTRAEGRALVAEPSEAAAVARARALHRRGASLRQIGDALAAEGHRPRRAERWHPTTVARLVRPGGPDAT